jgi:hypothetical protein
MEPRAPDPIYSMRLIDDEDYNPIDYNSINNLNSNELKQLEQIELDQIEQMEIEQLEMMQIKEMEEKYNFKKESIKDLVDKLNLIKSRIQSDKFELLDNKIKEYLNSLSPCVQIDEELNNFIQWLCTKTAFGRYGLESKLKEIFVAI